MRVAVTAGGTFVVDTAVLTTATGMGQVEGGRAPTGGSVALITGDTHKQPCMEGWLRVARRANRR